MFNSQFMVKRIRETAKKNNMSILELHEKIGLSRNALSQAEKSSGGMTTKNIYAIAEALECSVDYLLGRTDSPELKHEPQASIGLNNNNGMQAFHDMPIMLTVPADVQSEQQQEISSMLSDLNPRERTKLMMKIYETYDELKGNTNE